jgi:hypothetical protein
MPANFSSQLRGFLRWGARLALFALVFQLAAVDHWHPAPNDVAGVEGTSQHVLHCHGAGDCSDSGHALSAAPAAIASITVPPLLRAEAADVSLVLPQAVLAAADQPPRASL